MKNPDQNHEKFTPGNEDMQAKPHNPNPDRDTTGNWDETSHMSRSLEKNIRHDERRNLNPDQEKRTDRNGGNR